ncbi:MAG: hypothetical protein IPO08_23905 [Xanthomonadales bacterium]|nr:hypothetical protein [Xanthomonadales bacterium]
MATETFTPTTPAELTEQLRNVTAVLVKMELRVFALETAMMLRRSDPFNVRIPNPTPPQPPARIPEWQGFGVPAVQNPIRMS